MHVQNSLRRSLVDIDEHMYRVDLATAVAAVEADGLRHEKVWMDDNLNSAEVKSLTDGYRSKRRRQDAIWRFVGMLALLLFAGSAGVLVDGFRWPQPICRSD